MFHLYISESPPYCRMALTQDGQLKLYRTMAAGELMAGTVAVGRISKWLPGIRGAFVDVGHEQQVFVACNREDDSFKEGQVHLVSVTRAAESGKKAMAKMGASARGVFTVVESGHEIRFSRGYRRHKDGTESNLKAALADLNRSVLVRTSAHWASDDAVLAECQMLSDRLDGFASELQNSGTPRILDSGWQAGMAEMLSAGSRTEPVRVALDHAPRFEEWQTWLGQVAPEIKQQTRLHSGPTGLFDASKITSQVSALRQSKVWLKSGGFMLFNSRHGITTIDVNTGKGSQKMQTLNNQVKVNLEAADVAAQQIQLREIAGLIVVDFVSLKLQRDRERVEQVFRAAFAKDDLKTRIEPINSLGALMMSREKRAESRTEVESKMCAACKGEGRITSEDALCRELLVTLWHENRLETRDWTLHLNNRLYPFLHKQSDYYFAPLISQFGNQIQIVHDGEQREPYKLLPID